MDPVSQAMLGANFAMMFADRKSIKTAALFGALGGLAPDLDIVAYSPSDPLFSIEMHRHFTHSLAFAPLGSAIVALFLKLVARQTLLKTIFWFTFLGFITHGLLDACTTYGTVLYWPFSQARVAWSIISIIDPIFTGLLIFCFVLAVTQRARLFAKLGIVLVLCYLGYSYYNHYRVSQYVRALAHSRAHQVERLFVSPTIGNNILWRTLYLYNGHYYIHAVHASPFSNIVSQAGEPVASIDPERVFPSLPSDSIQRKDIRRFARFSNQYIYVHPHRSDIIADLRYASLPYGNLALWGIRVTPDTPNQHVRFGNLRHFDSKHFDEFWLMLKGQFNNGESGKSGPRETHPAKTD